MFELARVETSELIDLPGHAPDVLAKNLADMRRANRWAGGITLTLRALEHLTHTLPPNAPLTILDVATGIADIPRAIVPWAQRRNLQVRVLATDISPAILHIAQQASQAPSTKLVFVAADGLALPLADASVEVALCSFALHHLAPAQAAVLLREMQRVARHGIVVNDLVRWRPGYWATWLFTHALSRNPLTRNDGPLSVLRAYTRAEMRALAKQAGLRDVRFDSFLGYRVAMTAT